MICTHLFLGFDQQNPLEYGEAYGENQSETERESFESINLNMGFQFDASCESLAYFSGQNESETAIQWKINYSIWLNYKMHQFPRWNIMNKTKFYFILCPETALCSRSSKTTSFVFILNLSQVRLNEIHFWLKWIFHQMMEISGRKCITSSWNLHSQMIFFHPKLASLLCTLLKIEN